jgi:hypothetical protein
VAKAKVIPFPTLAAEKQPYIRCRTLGHSWFDYDSVWTPKWGTPLTLRCERCSMERRDTVSTLTGELLNRRYVRPANYQFAADEQRLARDDFRLLLLKLRGEAG